MQGILAVAATYLGRVLFAVVIWIVGRKAIGLLLELLERRTTKVKVDESLHSFLAPLVKMV